MKLYIVIIAISLILIPTSCQTCHYSCATCSSPNYYECLTCMPNRGNGGAPVYGMCYCDNSSDEDENGNCRNSNTYNLVSKILIVLFISLTLLFALFAVLVKGMKYFLYKTIEDVQELSLIVFINMYYPQQFDQFLTHLYRFNISSYTFQNLAEGTLFIVMPDSSVATVDGQNIFGKYKLLQKTANFFGNQFTWIIVFFCIFVVAVVIKVWRHYLKKNRDFVIIKHELEGKPLHNSSQAHLEESMNGSVGQVGQNRGNTEQWFEVEKRDVNEGECTLYLVVNRIHNMLWLHLLIVFFYFSIIEININIFTQIGNLTFSSDFATTGAFFSAFFLATEIVILALLFLKAKEEMVKPEWMRDHSYTPTIYLMRTNFKTVTKYFWFISCIKKVLLAMMITLFYPDPFNAIIAVCVVHTLYLFVAIYCEPHQRKYIRAHFYITEAAKLFLFLSLINFTTKYNTTVQLISLTQIFYGLLAFVFGMHLFFLLLSICIERETYKYFLNKKCCPEDHPDQANKRIGYRSMEKLFIYTRE